MTKRIFNIDNQSQVGTFDDADKDATIAKYEAAGYEVSEDHDGDLCINIPD